jgi:hypothetical protein
MGELAPGMKIEGHRLVPLFTRAEPIEGPRTTGIVDEDVEPAESGKHFILDAHGCVGLRDIRDDNQRLLVAESRDLVRRFSQAIFSPGHDREETSLLGKHLRDRAAEADTGTRDKRNLAGELEIHGIPLVAVT